jgi:nucleotide-binding universal stress UspA family protein
MSAQLEKAIAYTRTNATMHDFELRNHVVIGHPVPQINEFISEGYFDLLVLGYTGHSAIFSHLPGSTTDRLVRLAPCAVGVMK